MGKETVDPKYIKEGLLVWISCFVVAEFLGIISTFALLGMENPEVLSVLVYDSVTSVVRIAALFYFSRIFGDNFVRSVVFDLSKIDEKYVLKVIPFLAITIAVDIFFTQLVEGEWKLQLFEAAFFYKYNVAYGIVPRIIYYLSGILSLNYIYLLFRKGIKIDLKFVDGGIIGLFLLWSIPQAVNVSPAVSLYSFLIILVIYLGYKYTRNPLTPIILWMAAQIV